MQPEKSFFAFFNVISGVEDAKLLKDPTKEILSFSDPIVKDFELINRALFRTFKIIPMEGSK